MMNAENMITETEERRVKVEPISNGNLRIWLSDEDLCGSDAERSDNAENTWRLLRRVLQAAQMRLGHLGKHILAEIIPVAGGCVLLLSARKTVLTGGPLVYHIQSLDELYRLAERWIALPQREHTSSRNSLYEAQDGYDLVIYPAVQLTRRQTLLLREYGVPIGRGEVAAAAAAEHGRLLVAANALETLIGRESPPPKPLDRPR